MKSGFYKKSDTINAWGQKNIIMPCAAFMSAAALAGVSVVFANYTQEAEKTPVEVVEVDPWTQCIKSAADEAIHKGKDFERVANSCSRLAPALRHPA